MPRRARMPCRVSLGTSSRAVMIVRLVSAPRIADSISIVLANRRSRRIVFRAEAGLQNLMRGTHRSAAVNMESSAAGRDGTRAGLGSKSPPTVNYFYSMVMPEHIDACTISRLRYGHDSC